MKLRLHIVLPLRGSLLPARGSPARLPFVLVPVLAGMAVVQLALPMRIDLPPGGAVARVRLMALPDAPPAVIAPPLLASRDLFARPVGRGGPDSARDPLGGVVIAGVVQKGRLRLGVVQQASGQVHYVAVGGTIAGWRLAALDQAGARLTQGPGQNLVVPYGLHPSARTDAGTSPAGPTPAMTFHAHSPQIFESGQ